MEQAASKVASRDSDLTRDVEVRLMNSGDEGAHRWQHWEVRLSRIERDWEPPEVNSLDVIAGEHHAANHAEERWQPIAVPMEVDERRNCRSAISGNETERERRYIVFWRPYVTRENDLNGVGIIAAGSRIPFRKSGCFHRVLDEKKVSNAELRAGS